MLAAVAQQCREARAVQADFRGRLGGVLSPPPLAESDQIAAEARTRRQR